MITFQPVITTFLGFMLCRMTLMRMPWWTADFKYQCYVHILCNVCSHFQMVKHNAHLSARYALVNKTHDQTWRTESPLKIFFIVNWVFTREVLFDDCFSSSSEISINNLRGSFKDSLSESIIWLRATLYGNCKIAIISSSSSLLLEYVWLPITSLSIVIKGVSTSNENQTWVEWNSFCEAERQLI